MKIDIYYSDASEKLIVDKLHSQLGEIGFKAEFNHYDINRLSQTGFPPAILKHMLENKNCFPLTVLNSADFWSNKIPSLAELNQYQETLKNKSGFFTADNEKDDSSVKFNTRSRVHINLVVKDVKKSVEFYQLMFDQNPSKLMDDYAKFELEDPPINLALLEEEGALGHLGVQVKSTSIIERAVKRYEKAGLTLYNEAEVACCYAEQDKTWVVDPDGNKWEIFVVTNNQGNVACDADCICFKDLAPSI